MRTAQRPPSTDRWRLGAPLFVAAQARLRMAGRDYLPVPVPEVSVAYSFTR